MTRKQVTALIGLAVVAWHVISIVQDSERCARNLARFKARPTAPNFVKLAIAEGVLISDLRWL
jgi:hypothetical protein